MAAHRAATWGSFTLGVVATTPLDLANAYATVAAGGIYCKPLPVLSINDRDGPRSRWRARSAIGWSARTSRRPPSTRPGARSASSPTTTSATAVPRRWCRRILGTRPMGGKTGSSEQNATETFVGFTPQIAAGAIAADPADPTDLVGPHVEHNVTVAVAKTLASALKGLPYVTFPDARAARSRSAAASRP